MKKQKQLFLWIVGALLMLLPGISSLAQNPTYVCSLRNDVQVSQTVYEFDVFIQRTGGTVFKLAQFQMGINVNPLIKNGGTITVEPVDLSSQLSNAAQVPGPEKFTFIDASNCIRVTPVAPPGSGNASTILNTAPGTRFIRVRVINSVPFATAQPNLTWSFSIANGYPTKMFAYVGTTNTDITVQASHITTPLINPTLNPPLPPTAYNVTGTGPYCQGTLGIPVGLDNSEIGVTYTLFKNTVAQVPTVPGTGLPISFGNQLFGTYTVEGTNVIGSTAMTGSAIISETPSDPVSVSILADLNNICAGTTVTYTATPVFGGTTPAYQWYVNGVMVGTDSPTYSYIPANNDQVKVVLTSSITTCLLNNPATSNIITMNVSNPGPAGVSIVASANPSCGVDPVTFTATPVNGGTPSYQWYLNTLPIGTDQPTFTYVPITGDAVYVVMTSSLTCATANPATSNTEVMTVATPVPASVSMSTLTNPVCAGTSVTFTAVPINGGTPSYQWYKNGSAAGLNQDSYTYIPANNDEVYVVMTSGLFCTTGSPATSATTTMTVHALPTPTLAGPVSLCVNTTGNVYTTEAGFSNYVWNVSAGGSITAGGSVTDNTITVSWNASGAQSVSVNYTNPNNCTAASPTVYNVTVNPLPVPTITGPAASCVTSTGNVYTTETGMTSYSWVVSAGGSVTAGGTSTDNTITVTWNTVGPQTVSVNYLNANNCTAVLPTIYNVTVNPLPVPTLTGPASACVTSTGNVYTTEAGMSGYTWNVSAGGTITAGTGTNAITVTWTTVGAKTVSVNYTNANLCTAPAPTVYNVTVNPLPVPTLVGPNSVCALSTGNVYTTETGMTGYLWNVSAGGTITAGAGTNAITVTWNTAGANTVSVNYTNATSCTAPSATVLNVTVNALPVPTLSGATPVGVGTTQVYTTEAGKTNYVWAVSAGGAITAGGTSTSNTVTVLWNTAGAQTVSVNYNNASNCAAAAATVYPVTVLSVPPPAGAITGISVVCPGATGVPYSIAPLPNATGYVWTLPTGATIASGANTNSITVNFSYTAVSGVITVYGTNIYGNGGVSPNFSVTVNPSPVPTITGDSDICESSQYYYYSTEAGMSNYIWNISPNSGTITWVTGSNQIMVFWNAPGEQWVSVSYTNPAGCTAAAPTVLDVTINPLPVAAGAITGTATLCAGTEGVTYTVAPVTNATSYGWTVPAGATIVSGGATRTITVDFGLTAVSGTITAYGINDCGEGAPSSFAVTVNPVPEAPVITQLENVLTSSAATGNQWYFNGEIIEGATAQTYTVVYKGEYYSVVTLYGCSSLPSNIINVLEIVGIDDAVSIQKVSVYPNPNNGRFTVSITSSSMQVFDMRIVNNLGVSVYEQKGIAVDGTMNKAIELTNLPNGVYSVILNDSKKQIVRKVIVN